MISNHGDWRAIADLTDRQREILRGICLGQRNAEIGRSFGISPRTVKNHITAMLARTGANDRARLTYLYAKWEEVHRSAYVGGQVDVPIESGALSFRVVAQNRLLVRVGRWMGPADLFELSEEDSRRLRALLLSDINDGARDATESVEPILMSLVAD